MSASEKLRTLDAGFDNVTPICRKVGPQLQGADAFELAKDIHQYVKVLPQIVAVVEAAESMPDLFQTTDGGTHSLVPLLDVLEKALS